MEQKDAIIKKYKKKIEKLSEELATELLNTETDLDKRFTTLDSDVKKILMEVGSKTMGKIGSSLTSNVKKKPLKKG